MNKNKIIIATSIGTLLEWAEFSFYGYLAFKFAHLFFPNNQSNAVILSFAIFASSYLARPFGSILFGYIGDKYGRKTALTISLLSMGVATLGIGLTPIYSSIGIIAPILLVIFRIIQGISVSGEFTGAAIFIVEHYIGERKNLAVSWVSFSSALGMMIGAIFAAIISIPGLPDWSWRVPFYLGFLGCLIGIYLRIFTPESILFTKTKELNKSYSGLLKNIKFYYPQLIQCFFIAAFVGVYIYICNMWWTAYVIQKGYFNTESAHLLAMLGVVFVVILTPISALTADRYGTKRILIIGLITSLFTIPCIFWLTSISTYFTGFLAQFIYAFTNVLVTGAMFRYLTEIFPIELRYTCMGVSWSFAVAIFGGTAPMLAQYFAFDYKSTLAVIAYVIVISFLALIFILIYSKRNKIH